MNLPAGRAPRLHGLRPDAQQRSDLALDSHVDAISGLGANENEAFHSCLLAPRDNTAATSRFRSSRRDASLLTEV
jgi:hypothetical protein